jgi:hypothetical protein
MAQHSTAPNVDVLYQDKRWLGLARWQYGIFAYPFWFLGVAGSISSGRITNVLIVLAVFTPPIAICEWRLRKMGLIIRSDAILLVRPLNRTRIPWQDIEAFELIVPRGLIDYGDRRVGIRRRHGSMPRAAIRIPTVWLSIKGQHRWIGPKGPSGLKSSRGDITDVIGFLNGQLADHTSPEQLLAGGLGGPLVGLPGT